MKEELRPVRDRLIKLVNDLADGVPGRFAKAAGVHNTVIQRLFEDVSLPAIENLIKICQYAGVSADYILFGKESPKFQPLQPILTLAGRYPEIPPEVRPEDFLAVPLVSGEIAAGHLTAIPEEYVESFIVIPVAEIGRRQHHDLRAIRLAKTANSMRRTLKPGDIIIVDPTERPPQKPLRLKNIYAVRSEREGECAVKRVQEADDSWVLISDNPEYKPIILRKDQEDNPVIGQVIWSWTSWVR